MKLTLLNVRIAFAHGLFTASAFEEGQTPKFGADFLLVPGSSVIKEMPDGSKQVTTMSEVMLEIANDTWKGKGKEMLNALEASKKCYRDGNTRRNKSGDLYEGYEGVMYVTAKNKTRPAVIDRDRTPLTEEDGRPYSGCYVNAIIDVYGMPDAKKKGVHAALKGVQFVKEGDSFGGGAPASAEEFEDLGVPAGADADDLS